MMDELDHFINNTSIRLRLKHKDSVIDLPGDIYAAYWEQFESPPCSILKLPHHGHKDSITPALLDKLRPEHVVISVSNSRTDDCPSQYTMELLKEYSCELYITDAVSIDGEEAVKHESVHFGC